MREGLPYFLAEIARVNRFLSLDVASFLDDEPAGLNMSELTNILITGVLMLPGFLLQMVMMPWFVLSLFFIFAIFIYELFVLDVSLEDGLSYYNENYKQYRFDYEEYHSN